MLPIDALTKHFVQTYPHHFLQFTFQRDDIQLVEILPTEQTTVETRHLDTLFKVQIDGQPALVHYEFQTTDSTPSMPRRMAMTRELPLDSPAKANMALGLAFYSSLTYDKLHLSILLSKERLMALVKESEFARDFLDMLREEFGDELRSEAEAEVRAEVEAEIRGQVIEQGIKQGIKQGREQGIRHSIQAVLELRFGASAAQAFAARLASIDDVQRLDHLHRVAVQASKLEEVSRLLDD